MQDRGGDKPDRLRRSVGVPVHSTNRASGPGAPAASQWFNRSIGRGFRGRSIATRAVMKTHEHRVAVGTAFIGLGADRISTAERGTNSSASAHGEPRRRAGGDRDHGAAHQPRVPVPARYRRRRATQLCRPQAQPPLVGTHGAGRPDRRTSLGGGGIGRHQASSSGWTRRPDVAGGRCGMELSTCSPSPTASTTRYTPHRGLWHNFYNMTTRDGQVTPPTSTPRVLTGAAAANHAETELAMIDLHDQLFRSTAHRVCLQLYQSRSIAACGD